jgi:VIT1/CCC1 family predicted Fe2+/Mn2+ transporter
MNDEKHFKSSDLLRDVIIGMSDGLTVPFALAAGLSGAVASNNIIITAGIAEIVAGSISMGLGGYLAGKTEMEHYQTELQREYDEVKKVPEKEMQEVRDAFKEYGISAELQNSIALELSQNHQKWVEFMMRYELELEKPDVHRASRSAMNIGLSYIVGGIVPLLGYVIMRTPGEGLFLSTIITILCLFIFGYVKTRFTSSRPILGGIKTVLIGLVAAATAFSIAKLIS